jgi:hypothetical protein
MQTLEDRTEKSRREMDLHDTIDTVRVLNARNRNVDIDKVCCARVHCVYLANVQASASCKRSILTPFKDNCSAPISRFPGGTRVQQVVERSKSFLRFLFSRLYFLVLHGCFNTLLFS